MALPGGPCACCEATFSSAWYGGQGNQQYCKKRKCMRAGGYAEPLGTVRNRQQRQRTSPSSQEEEEASTSTDLSARVSKIFTCLGHRCARRSRLPLFARHCAAPPSAEARVLALRLTVSTAAAHRFCNVENLTALQRRNTLNADSYEVEYLLHAKFHGGNDDPVGYVSTAWTPLSMLGDIDPQALVAAIDAYDQRAQGALNTFTAPAGGAAQSPHVP